MTAGAIGAAAGLAGGLMSRNASRRVARDHEKVTAEQLEEKLR
jgi:hypothetical protein